MEGAMSSKTTTRPASQQMYAYVPTIVIPRAPLSMLSGLNVSSRFEGYYNNPEAEAARKRNGWYWTGDLGYVDADGFFYFAGRNGDWLRVDSENFAAGPVEAIMPCAESPATRTKSGLMRPWLP